MSATLIAPAVIENVHSVEPSPRSLELDAQLWLGPNHFVPATPALNLNRAPSAPNLNRDL
jgi:hypothetical protein